MCPMGLKQQLLDGTVSWSRVWTFTICSFRIFCFRMWVLPLYGLEPVYKDEVEAGDLLSGFKMSKHLLKVEEIIAFC